MKTRVGLSHEPKRKLPWLVYWFGEPDDSGRQRKYSKTFRYKRNAQAFQASKQKELDDGGPRDRVKDVTLGRLLDKFWQARVAGLGFKSKECYQSTLDQLREHFGNERPIQHIKQEHAEIFMTSRKRRDGRGGGLSSWTRRQRLTHCRAVFRAAVDWGHLEANPFRVPAGQGSSPLRVKGKSRPWQHLRPDEFQRMLTVVPSVKRRAAYWLMYGCGLRPGEAYNLTIDRIDLDNRCVHIANRNATDDIPPFVVKCDERTTESKERTVSIPKAAIPDVTAACQEGFRSGGFVILTAERFATVQRCWRLCREGRPWGGRETHRPWQNRDMVNNLLRDTRGYLRKAGVKLTAPFTLTTFRKSFGQNHAEAGTPPRTLAELMGHTDTAMTMKFYNQANDANKRAASRAQDRMFGKLGKRAVAAS